VHVERIADRDQRPIGLELILLHTADKAIKRLAHGKTSQTPGGPAQGKPSKRRGGVQFIRLSKNLAPGGALVGGPENPKVYHS
jgi:hypothetical protein